MKHNYVNTILATVLLLFSIGEGTAKTVTEPLGGQPLPNTQASVSDLEYQVKYQRAFEAVLWGMPAVAIYRFRAAAMEDLGMKDNDIIT